MKTHEEFAALLDAFVDGELSSEDTQAVQNHLNTCPDCRAYVDDCLAIRAAFPTVEETEVPTGFAEGVMAAVRAQSAPARRKKQPWTKALLPLAACFALVLLVSTALQPAADNGAGVTEARMASEEEAPAAETQDAAAFALEEEIPYFVHATLTAEEAGTALDAFQAVCETDTELYYCLTAPEYDALLDTLAAHGAAPVEEALEEGREQALVTVRK